MSEEFTDFTNSPDHPDNKYDPLEMEIAERVVRPSLQALAEEESPTSKNHLYQMWVQHWGNISRARFDTWLEMLNIRFVRIVRVVGLYKVDPSKPEPDAPYMDDSDNVVMAFDNESDGDL